MGLLAWYPLNGDTRDYSGNGNDATNSGATIDDSGKIGKCYKFTKAGSDGVYLSNRNFTELKDGYSMSLWVNPAGAHQNYNGTFISSGNWNGSCWAFGVSQDNTRIDVLGRGYNKWISYSLSLNTWTHLTCVVKNNISALYANGEFVGQLSVNGSLASDATNAFIGRETYANGYFSFNGKINDIRIYDHALSTKEIKEIAKAKILHYTFDDFQEPTVNLATDGLSTYTPYNVITSRTGQDLVITMQSSTQYLTLHNGVDYNGKIITLSGIMKKNGRPHSLPGDRANTYHTLKALKWFFDPLTGYFEIVENCNAASVWAFHTAAGTVAGDVITIDNFQIEEKDHATPFTPSSRSGKIKDISGYNNDAALSLTTTPQWVNDSKIGGGAYKFTPEQSVTTNVAITSNNFTRSDSSYTIASFVKLHAAPTSGDVTLIGGAYYSGFALAINPSGGIRTYYRNSIAQYGTASYALPIDEWVHVAGVLNQITSTIQLYINGILFNQANIEYGPFAYETMKLRINHMQQTGGDNFTTANATIDDVRIYATALSQQDVEELYKTKANIDNGGNLMLAQFIENIEPTVNICTDIRFQGLGYGLSYSYVGIEDGWHKWSISGTGTNDTYPYTISITPSNILLSTRTSFSFKFKTNVYSKFVDGFRDPRMVNIVYASGYSKTEIDYGSWREAKIENVSPASGSESQTQDIYFLSRPIEGVAFNPSTDFVYFKDVQSERKTYATPFTHKSRLQSTDIPVGHIYKNSIEQNGCLGHEDISEVGITNGLIAYYPFDKDAKDYSGYRSHGTLSGAVTTVGGVDGNAKLFKAAGDKMAINSVSGDVLTLCAWHKWDTASTNWRTLFGNTGNYHHLIFNNDRSLNIWDGAQRKFNYSVPDNNWHHYVVVINSGVNASLYVDGVFNSTITIALNLKTYPVQFIGNYCGDSYPCGTLDEVRIYDRPLSAEEVAILYDTTRPDKPSVKLTKDMLYLSGELKEGL